ncbi:tetratricopeptide repeat protein 37-like [Oscarella lobularis]|uniref:tetratricopeptide repeat protein 37-like n=1 Tax=Oscarella lobularis TaxID=121494 RepID=UPI0033139D6E
MSSKEAKAELKAAREAIRQKEYKDALKHCKAVLKLDKNNYNALLFVGKCASEMDQPDQARAAFKKAVEVDETSPLAWQGLAVLFEKENKNRDFQIELLSVYDHLAKLNENEVAKWVEIKAKQGSLYRTLQQSNEAIECWHSLASKDKENRLKWIGLVAMGLNKRDSKSQEERAKFLDVLAELTKADSLEKDQQVDFGTMYIRELLHQCQCKNVSDINEVTQFVSQTKDECISMRQRLPDVLYPLEILCQFYLHENLDAMKLPESVVATYEDLYRLGSKSPWVKLCQCHMNLVARNLEKAGEILSEVDSSRSIEALCLIASLHDAKHENTLVIEVAEKGLRLSSRHQYFYHLLTKHLRLCLAQAHFRMGEVSLPVAHEVYTEVHKTYPWCLVSGCGLARCALLSGDSAKAHEICNALAEKHLNSHELLALQAEIFLVTNCLKAAKDKIDLSLSMCNSKSTYFFISAKTLWLLHGSSEARKNQCFAHFLQAAKLDPYYSDAFLYLGHCYLETFNDTNKSRRCYFKAIDLDPSNVEAGKRLTSLCESMGKTEEAIEVYKKIASKNSPERAKWAWFQLGIRQLEMNQYNEAVVSFQSVTKADPKNKESWERLGDAYEGRGAYAAAIKAFMKASELDSNCLYCLYRIATLKRIMDEPREAVEDFQKILDVSSSYVPALKGMSESLLVEARNALMSAFVGKAVSCVDKALKTLARAVIEQSELVSLWKLVGDCCMAVSSISKNALGKISIPVNFLPENCSTDEKSGKTGLLCLAPRAYATGLQFLPTGAFLWHDLGISLYCQSQEIIRKEAEKSKILQSALQALQKAVRLDSECSEYWNSLGMISMHPTIGEFALAQHGFIKSIQLQQTNAIAWTNLGVLYLRHDNKKLAHEAFKKGQASDPDYVPAWIGQALIAEGIGDQDAMDLFRHTTELGVHTESQIGYAHWVCSTLAAKSWVNDPGESEASDADDKAVLRASDCLARYTASTDDDSCAYNMYGILLERQGRHREAETAFRKCVELLSSENVTDRSKLDIAIANHARSLSFIGKHLQSIALFNTLSSLSDVYDVAFLALALFKANRLRDCYKVYEQALELASSQADKSAALACLGITAYALQDKSKSKSLLFRSSQMSPPCVDGILGLCSLGLMSKDFTLASAALAELIKLRDSGREKDEHLAAQIVFMTSNLYVLQGKLGAAKKCVNEAIHNYPDRAELWKLLSQFLAQYYPEKSNVVSSSAVSAWRLSGNRVSEDVPFLVSLGAVGAGNRLACPRNVHWSQEALRSSQKALHADPSNAKTWALFSAALFSSANKASGSAKQLATLAVKIAKTLQSKVELESKELQLAAGKDLPLLFQSKFNALHSLQQWATHQVIASQIYCGQVKEAAYLAQQVIQLYSSRPNLGLPFRVWLSYIVFLNSSEEDSSKALANLRDLVCALKTLQIWPWELLSDVYISNFQLFAAKESLQQAIEASRSSRGQLIGNLLMTAWIALRCCLADPSCVEEGWPGIANECLLKVQELDVGNVLVYVFQGILHYIGKNFRGARRCLDNVLHLNSVPQGVTYLAKYYLIKVLLSKKETVSRAKAIAEEAVAAKEMGSANLSSLVSL